MFWFRNKKNKLIFNYTLLFYKFQIFMCFSNTILTQHDGCICRSNQEEARFAKMEEDRLLRESGLNITNVTIPFVDSHFNVGIFSAIIGAVFLFGLLRALMFFKVAVDASQMLHNKMFASILRAQIGFFDTNPVGKFFACIYISLCPQLCTN